MIFVISWFRESNVASFFNFHREVFEFCHEIRSFICHLNYKREWCLKKSIWKIPSNIKRSEIRSCRGESEHTILWERGKVWKFRSYYLNSLFDITERRKSINCLTIYRYYLCSWLSINKIRWCIRYCNPKNICYWKPETVLNFNSYLVGTKMSL